MPNNQVALTDYDSQLAEIQRRQRMADALSQQSSQPIEVSAYKGIQAPISPLSGLAKVLQSYMAGSAEHKADTDFKDLLTQQKAQKDQQYTQMLSSLVGGPGGVQPSMGSDPGNIPQDGSAPVQSPYQQTPGTPGLLPADQAAKLGPVLRNMSPETGSPIVGQLMANALKPQEPYNLDAGASRYGADNKLINTAPDKPEKPNFNAPFNVDGTPNKAYQDWKIADEKRAQAPQWATLAERQRHDKETEADANAPPDADTVKYWAQSVAQGAPLPTLGMGKQAAAYRQAILKEAAQINSNKGLTGADQNALTGTTKANMGSLAKITPLRAATEAYEGTMLQNMDLLKQQMTKGAGTYGAPVLNRWQQYIRKEYGGDPDVASFNTAMQTVKNEYAKIQSGSIGNAPVSDSARQEAESMLDPSQTPAQIQANLDYMVKETGNRTRSLRAQEDSLRGGLSGKNDQPALDKPAPPAAPGTLPRANPGEVIHQDAQGHRAVQRNGAWVEVQ